MTSFEKGQFTLVVFIDLSKAFYTVNHSTLLSKLELYGIKSKYLNCFKPNLKHRQRFVLLGRNENSICCRTICRELQDLNTFDTHIGINDLFRNSSKLTLIMFTDETTFFISDFNKQNLFETINEELSKVGTWFIANKLSLNIS